MLFGLDKTKGDNWLKVPKTVGGWSLALQAARPCGQGNSRYLTITIKPSRTGRLHTRAINPFGFMTSAFHRIHKALGPGLLESNYELAMAVELGHLGIPFVRQQQYPWPHARAAN